MQQVVAAQEAEIRFSVKVINQGKGLNMFYTESNNQYLESITYQPDHREIFRGGEKMAFVNEYISEEDIQKYNLVDAAYRYNPVLKLRGLPSTWKPMWTVDKEREFFLKEVGPGHREELSNRKTWMLFIGRNEYKVETDLYGDADQKLSDVPYHIEWDLVKIDPAPNKAEYEVVIAALKEALIVYGYAGARRQLPDTIVRFRF